MTIEEAIIELRSQQKVYHNAKMSQPYFSQMLKKIENGHCKPMTTKKFMSKFDYVIQSPEQWIKK